MLFADAKWLAYSLNLIDQGQSPELTTGLDSACLKFSLDADAVQNRSEIYDKSRSNYWGMAWNVEFDLYIPQDFETDSKRTILHQWHGSPDPEDDTQDVPFMLRAQDNQVGIVVSSIPERVGGSKGTEELLYDEPIVRGAWEKWKFEIAFHWEQRADYPSYLRAWRNGAQIVDYTGAIGFNDSIGPYAKWGIYHWLPTNGSRTNKTVYFRNIVKERI